MLNFYSFLRELFIQIINKSIRLVYLTNNNIMCAILPDGFGCFEEIFFKHTYFEPETISCADVVIDLGAHQGTFTVYSVLYMKPNSILVSVEPNPRTYYVLLENLRLLKHIISKKKLKIYVINRAVYTTKRFVKLKLTRWSESSHISLSGDVDIQTITFREIFSLFQHIKDPKVLLKMDIEGTEHILLIDKQSLNFIGMCKHIAIEFHGNFNRIKQTLEHLGFKVTIRDIALEPTLYRKWLKYKPKPYTGVISIYRLIASSIAKPKITIVKAEQ